MREQNAQSMIHIGTKLPRGYRTDPDNRRYFDFRSDVPAYLASMGLTFVEYPLNERFDEAEVLMLARTCDDRGLRVNLHPYNHGRFDCARFERASENACFDLTRRHLELADRIAQMQGHHCVLNLHPASAVVSAVEERREIAERSRQYFGWLVQEVENRGLGVLVTAEFQEPAAGRNPPVRIGDRYDELLEITRGLESESFGLCWDTGHTTLARLRRGASNMPAPDFARRVRHVHLHDVIGERDHVPLNDGLVAYDDHLATLRDLGYSGDINLEYSPSVCLASGYTAEILRDSIQRVKKAWGDTDGVPPKRKTVLAAG